MQYSPILETNPPAQAESKPSLTSHDSGQECSLEHWLEVCRLVEIAEREDREPKRNAFDDSFFPIF